MYQKKNQEIVDNNSPYQEMKSMAELLHNSHLYM